jgi:hypothetical protein
MHATCHTHPTLTDFIILIIINEENKLWSCPLSYSLQPQLHPCFLGNKKVIRWCANVLETDKCHSPKLNYLLNKSTRNED